MFAVSLKKTNLKRCYFLPQIVPVSSSLPFYVFFLFGFFLSLVFFKFLDMFHFPFILTDERHGFLYFVGLLCILWLVSLWMGGLLKGLITRQRFRQAGFLLGHMDRKEAGRPSNCQLNAPLGQCHPPLHVLFVQMVCGNPDSP